MPRLSPLPQLALLVCAAALLVGCKTIYTDVYSPLGNRFVRPPEQKIALPEDRRAVPLNPAALPPAAAGVAPAIPGVDMGAAPMPAP